MCLGLVGARWVLYKGPGKGQTRRQETLLLMPAASTGGESVVLNRFVACFTYRFKTTSYDHE